MALIKCSECGKEFSDKASACPNCACPNKKNKTNDLKISSNKKNYLIIGGIIVLVLIIFGGSKIFNIGGASNDTSINGVYKCDTYGKCQLGNKVILSENNICSLPDKPSIQSCSYTSSGETIYINYTINGYANGQLDGSYNHTIYVDDIGLTDENGYTYSKE